MSVNIRENTTETKDVFNMECFFYKPIGNVRIAYASLFTATSIIRR